jgi:hypothetical protein
VNVLAIALAALLAQTASIEGIVVRGTNDPLSRAIVELHADNSNNTDETVLSSATTEEDGRFRFQSVRPGRYRLSVKRQGYTRPPLTVTLAAGQPMQDLRLTMAPTGAIYGRILDHNGSPFGNIEVQALKPSYPGGRRALTLVQSVRTNDLGEYRLFWLPAGRYFVAAVHLKAQDPRRRMRSDEGVTIIGGGFFFASDAAADPALGNPFPEPDEDSRPEMEGYVPVYFPGTSDEQGATAIDLRAGADFGSVNIVVAPARRRLVRGVVIDGGAGKPAVYASVRTSDESHSRDEVDVDQANGSFEIALYPGRHRLTADSEAGRGYVDIQVGEADIQNVAIVTSPTFDIRGRITSDDPKVSGSDLASLRISLRRDNPVSTMPNLGSFSTALPDGSFNVEATAGNYRVGVAPILTLGPEPFSSFRAPTAVQNGYVKSIRLGDMDVLNNGLRVERPPDTPLEIVVATNPGVIEGTAAPDVSIVLVPDIRHRVELYQATVADPAARFRFDRIPPGDYKIFAWTEVETGIWHDADFLKSYEIYGRPVRVAEESSQRVQISVIP